MTGHGLESRFMEGRSRRSRRWRVLRNEAVAHEMDGCGPAMWAIIVLPHVSHGGEPPMPSRALLFAIYTLYLSDARM
ncbi:uncharacterized protein BDV17DRAFT_85270 [Aspergillus undulatus]|uniref:uncharacterized protein n=1 Tax=Aspergillus undulatus TaxID=1810928 RepID=UPI003CCD909A